MTTNDEEKNRLSTTYSSRSFLYLISCIQWIVWSKIVEASTHPNSQQWSERKKRRQPSTLTSTSVCEATNAVKWPHCWSVDNLLILTYGCNDVDFYRMINTMTIGTLSNLSLYHWMDAAKLVNDKKRHEQVTRMRGRGRRRNKCSSTNRWRQPESIIE